jgi:hypothetical protein
MQYLDKFNETEVKHYDLRGKNLKWQIQWEMK